MSTQHHPEALADTAAVAAFLRLPAKTLDQWAYQGKGPRYSKVGRHRRYRWADVERWLDEHATTPQHAAT